MNRGGLGLIKVSGVYEHRVDDFINTNKHCSLLYEQMLISALISTSESILKSQFFESQKSLRRSV